MENTQSRLTAGKALRITLVLVLLLSGLLIATPAWGDEGDTQTPPTTEVQSAEAPDGEAAAEPQETVVVPEIVADSTEVESTVADTPEPDNGGFEPLGFEPLAVVTGSCGTSATWSFNTSTGELVISGTGAISDTTNASSLWGSYKPSIKKVTINSGITRIGANAFYGCTNLLSITIPNTVTSIGSSAFTSCSRLGSVSIPSSVTAIEASAFQYCQSLASLSLAAGLKTIDADAFSFCTSLVKVTIPASVTSIGNAAFAYCTGITSFAVVAGSQDFSVDSSGVLFERYKSYLVQYPAGNSRSSYALPTTTKEIMPYAFSGATSLMSVTLSSGIEEIGEGAFIDCTKLSAAVLPNSVTSLGNLAFFGCTNLSVVTLPTNTSFSTLEASTFENCPKLQKIVFPANITAIGDGAFASTGLTSVSLTSSIAQIGEAAFADCNSLGVVFIPNTVTTILGSAFSGVQGPLYCAAASRPAGWSSEWLEGFTGEQFWGQAALPGDTQAPILVATSVTRSSETEAKIYFSSNEAGRYYSAKVSPGAAIPAIDMSGSGTAMLAGTQSVTVGGLSAEAAYDLYIVGKDASGNISSKLKVIIPDYRPNLTGWVKLANFWYYYQAGKPQTGWIKTSNLWFYLDPALSGRMLTGLQFIDGGWFYFRGGDSGRMETGWKEVDGNWYYFRGGDSGRAETGWFKYDGSWFFFDRTSARMYEGMIYDDGSWFLLKGNGSGRMLTGWQLCPDGYYRYFRTGDSGRSEVGWMKWDGSWFYLDPVDAHMYLGINKINGSWYDFKGGTSGRMLTGWQKENGSWYYFQGGDNGRAYTGWQHWGDVWYYFDVDSAKMLYGFQYLEYKGQFDWYYLGDSESGKMVTGKVTVGGVQYTFDSSGRLVSPSAPA